jgi:hypothetical protein
MPAPRRPQDQSANMWRSHAEYGERRMRNKTGDSIAATNTFHSFQVRYGRAGRGALRGPTCFYVAIFLR